MVVLLLLAIASLADGFYAAARWAMRGSFSFR
jgi:hypothetical protein